MCIADFNCIILDVRLYAYLKLFYLILYILLIIGMILIFCEPSYS